MLPLGILYFTIAVAALAVALRLALAPLVLVVGDLGLLPVSGGMIQIDDFSYGSPQSVLAALVCMALGVVILARYSTLRAGLPADTRAWPRRCWSSRRAAHSGLLTTDRPVARYT